MSITERVAPEPPQVEDEVVLSRRELVVLANLSEDVTLEQVAARLFVTRNTVKSQLRSIYRKLGVSTRSEAVTWARVNGVSDR